MASGQPTMTPLQTPLCVHHFLEFAEHYYHATSTRAKFETHSDGKYRTRLDLEPSLAGASSPLAAVPEAARRDEVERQLPQFSPGLQLGSASLRLQPRRDAKDRHRAVSTSTQSNSKGLTPVESAAPSTVRTSESRSSPEQRDPMSSLRSTLTCHSPHAAAKDDYKAIPLRKRSGPSQLLARGPVTSIAGRISALPHTPTTLLRTDGPACASLSTSSTSATDLAFPAQLLSHSPRADSTPFCPPSMPAASTSTSRSKRKPRRSTGNLPWQPLRKFLEFEIESLTTTAGTEGNTCAFGSRPWVCEACTKSSTEELGNVSAGQLMAGQSTASKATQLHNNDVWRDWSKTRVPKVRKFQFAGATFTVDACHEPMVLMLRSAPFEE